MNLLQLQYFYTVAKEGGFTKAAKVLYVQQPSISRMVQQLEDSLGFALFEQIGRQIRLTPRGKEVYARAQKIFAEVDSLKSEIGALKGIPQGPLAFGAAEPIVSHFVPDVLEKLLPEFPKLYPVIASGPSSLILEKIQSGDLEFGLFFHLPSLPEQLHMRVLKKVRFYLVVRKDLRKRDEVIESFIGSREIDDITTRRFPTLEKLQKTHPKAAIRISSNNLTAHRSMVMKGLGVSVLPDFLVEKDLQDGSLADLLPKEKLEFDLKWVQRETAVLSLNARTFLAGCSGQSLKA